VIRRFRHKGLADFFTTGSRAGIQPVQAGRWSVHVSGNWRLTFSFNGKDANDVDFEDYH
jgi:proteic killer suppression protein